MSVLDKQNAYYGFTLIELLVVISIIAILSVIGIAIFSGVQKSARDARRIADVNAIVSSLEVHHNCGGAYCNIDNTYFADGSVPTDPLTGQSRCAAAGNDFCGYCITSQNAQPGDPTNWANHGCGAITPSQPTSYWYNLVQIGSPGATDNGSTPYQSSFIVCANLEKAANGKYYYCRSSSQ